MAFKCCLVALRRGHARDPTAHHIGEGLPPPALAAELPATLTGLATWPRRASLL